MRDERGDDESGDDIDLAALDRLVSIMSQVDSTDVELVDPPEGLWARIAAAIAAEPDETPPGAGVVVEYCIDADDVVVAVGEDWSTFARENGAPELDALSPDRTIWSYFDNDEVRDVWRLLVEQVRATHGVAQVPLRCDAPHMRRWFEMTITAGPEGTVDFRSVLVFEEPRTTVALLSGGVARDPDRPAVPVCSWCGDGYDGSRWRQIEELVRELRLFEDQMPSIDYGICPTCREVMSSDLQLLPSIGRTTLGRDRSTPLDPPAGPRQWRVRGR
ncbi:MAG: hypothetical protein ACK4V6_07855 [Microthrixaceae bacterium]